MKVIIAGSRTITDRELVIREVWKLPFEITEVVSGGARGVDAIGEWIAEIVTIPVCRFPADWDKHGKAAGPIRNKQMAEYADAAIVIWDGKSRGSKNMIETMKKLGKPVMEVIVDES